MIIEQILNGMSVITPVRVTQVSMLLPLLQLLLGAGEVPQPRWRLFFPARPRDKPIQTLVKGALQAPGFGREVVQCLSVPNMPSRMR